MKNGSLYITGDGTSPFTYLHSQVGATVTLSQLRNDLSDNSISRNVAAIGLRTKLESIQ